MSFDKVSSNLPQFFEGRVDRHITAETFTLNFSQPINSSTVYPPSRSVKECLDYARASNGSSSHPVDPIQFWLALENSVG